MHPDFRAAAGRMEVVAFDDSEIEALLPSEGPEVRLLSLWNLPVISYYYCGRSTDDDCQGGGDLRVAQRTQTGWETVTVDTEGNTGLFTSIEVSDTGTIYVSYYDQSTQTLKMAVHR